MTKRWLRHLFPLISVPLLSILPVSVSLLSIVAVPAHAAPAPAVIVERVTTARVADTLEALGTLRANERVDVSAKVSDTISFIRFDDGDAVEAGQVLAELTDTEEAALLKEAESLAEEAKAQYERFVSLVKKGSASESLLDERRQLWRTAEARREAVRSRLKDRLITAPFSGRVGLRRVSPGALVNPGDVITTLVDDTRMKLDFTIPALYLGTIRSGTPIEAVTPVFPERVFAGTVTSVDSTVDPVTRSITVRAVLPNPDRDLVGGMLMTLELSRNPREAIVISEEAVVPRADRTFVLVVDMESEAPHPVEQRRVELGARLPGRVEIASGLSVGETIVKHGTLKVRPGVRVRIHAIDDATRPIAELLRPQAAQGGR